MCYSKAIYEFVGTQYLKLSSTSALFGANSVVDTNIRYINIENSSIYNNNITVPNFCSYLTALMTIKLPNINFSGGSALVDLYSLHSLSLHFILQKYIPGLTQGIYHTMFIPSCVTVRFTLLGCDNYRVSLLIWLYCLPI